MGNVRREMKTLIKNQRKSEKSKELQQKERMPLRDSSIHDKGKNQ